MLPNNFIDAIAKTRPCKITSKTIIDELVSLTQIRNCIFKRNAGRKRWHKIYIWKSGWNRRLPRRFRRNSRFNKVPWRGTFLDVGVSVKEAR